MRKLNNLNSVLIEGTLAEDPDFRATPKSARSVCTFKLASNRCYKEDNKLKQEVYHFSIETWDGLAERVYDLGKKGRGVRVVGHLKEYCWITVRGERQSKVTVVAEHVEFSPEFKKTSTRKRSQGKINKE